MKENRGIFFGYSSWRLIDKLGSPKNVALNPNTGSRS